MGYGNKFRRVHSGDDLEISARTWNGLLEAAETVSSSRYDTKNDRPRIRTVHGGLLVRVKNSSGSDVDQFCPLMLSGASAFDATNDDQKHAFEYTPVLVGVEPDADPDKAFVITQEPIENGKHGLCILTGLTPAIVNITHADHTHATLKEADLTQLDSAMFGHRIYYKPSGTGTLKECYIGVGIESCNPYKGVASEDIDPGTSGLFKFAVGSLGALTAIGADFTGTYAAGSAAGTITENSELLIYRTLGEWLISPVECPE